MLFTFNIIYRQILTLTQSKRLLKKVDISLISTLQHRKYIGNTLYLRYEIKGKILQVIWMDLTQLSRTEKDNNLLQKLPENFYEVAKGEISIQEQEASLAESDIEQMILQENVTTERRAYQNLRTIRIKKILKIAALDAYRDEPEHANDFMQECERLLYNNIITGISNIK